jgi:2-polyprenyl-3-methyl-5-hydroxy-6-metoxy-1,4-benzoquinol methylase
LSTEFRKSIFKNYGCIFQNTDGIFDIKQAELYAKAYRWYLRGWLPESKDAEIVDLGCGQGKFLYFLKKQGYKNIRGIDLSPDQVNCARKVTDNVERANILDCLTKQKNNNFDLITAFDVIEHFTKDEALKFLNLSFSLLKPNGRIILQTPNADSPFGTTIRYGDITHEWCYNENQLRRLLKHIGYTEIEARETEPVRSGYSIKSSIRWLMWQCLRIGLKAWNIVETGTSGSGILTRVFLISGRRHNK